MSVGTPEILVILLVALLVFGPQRLPEVGRQVGAAMRELRRIQDTVRGELDMVMHPEHGTSPGDAPDEPGGHSDYSLGSAQFGGGDFGDGYSDFTPPDATDPAAADLDRVADDERRFLGPPGSFI